MKGPKKLNTISGLLITDMCSLLITTVISYWVDQMLPERIKLMSYLLKWDEFEFQSTFTTATI